MGRKLTQKEFVDRSNLKHGGRYNYDKAVYRKSGIKVEVICYHHGSFFVAANHHMNGIGCRKCGYPKMGEGRRRTIPDLKREFRRVHGNKYDYSLITEYKTNKQKLPIVCPEHGKFYQSANNHISKAAGCFKCALYLKGGFSRTRYIESASKNHGGLSNLYILECSGGKGELFYKIGITHKRIERRFYGEAAMPYKYNIVKVLTMSADFVWDFEKRLHLICADYSYKPELSFAGMTECFSKIPKEVTRLIDNIKAESQLQLIA